jgi:DNA-binding response OmpR family regulator
MNEKILLVEDSVEVRSGLQIALQASGYTVVTAGDGREGINLFRQEKPHLALLDIRMPKLSGIDVCTLIRNESDVPVVMFSGVMERADVLLAIQRGANDYVLKDSGFSELLKRVQKHLRLRAAATLSTTPLRSRPGAVLPFSGGVPPELSPFTVVRQGRYRAEQDAVSDLDIISKPGMTSGHFKPPVDMNGLRVQTVRVQPEPAGQAVDGDLMENLIVVAHSEPESLDQLATVAARTGYEVVKASTGQAALQVLAVRRPKLVLLGNTLTDMSCFSVVEAVAQHGLGEMIGIVIAAGRRSPELARRARYLGVHGTVYRPWEYGRLDVAIRSALAATRKARSGLAA